MFLSFLGALLWQIKNNPVCGRRARQQKTIAATQNCCTGQAWPTINQTATNVSFKLITTVCQLYQMLKAKINYIIIIKILSKIETDPSFAAFISAFEYYLTSPVPISIKSDTKHLKGGENFFK